MVGLKLNPKAVDAHYKVVAPLLTRRADNILHGRIGRGDDRPIVTPQMQMYLTDIRDNPLSLSGLIRALPQNLPGIIASHRQNFPQFERNLDDKRVLKNLFVESAYDHDDFNKLDFIKMIDLDTCAYCNRNYIYYLSGMEARPIKPQIDHFYPKAKYPFLAVSFYNLIPSCTTCNGFEAKGELCPIELGLVNPYELTDFDQFKFTYKIHKIDVLRPLSGKHHIDVKFSSKIDSHDQLFRLEKLYQQHSDHVLELIIKSQSRYAPAYRRYLESYTSLRFDNFEIERLLLGNYAKKSEVHKRSLAKLYQDIGRELKLIR